MTCNNDYQTASAANDNPGPFATAATGLAYLYHLRRDMLIIDLETMSFIKRRKRQEALKKFAVAETLLLAEL